MIAITELTLLTAPKAILREWLEAYFDGQPHDVGAHAAVVFPKANIAFGQGAPAQPLASVDNPRQSLQTSAEIRVLCLPRFASNTWNSDAQQGEHLLATDSVLFQFQIRANAPKGPDRELLADQVAQLLKALLTNPDTRFVLARSGLAHLSPNQPVPIASTDYALRLLNCGAQLSYAILLTDSVPAGEVVSTLVSGQRSLPFTREMPLVAGEYLLGRFELAMPLVAVAATATGCAGTEPTVLELEVGGELTGVIVTLPPGPPNEEVTVTVDLQRYLLPAGQAVRWKIVGSTEAEAAAWKVSLELRLG